MDVLVISDLHAPYHHPGAFDFLAELRKNVKPDAVVCIGDEADMHRFSSHPQHPELPGPAEELRLARQALKNLYKLFPKVQVCNSNHGCRVMKRAAEAGIPAAALLDMRALLEAPAGWEWRDWWDINGVHYRHGDGFSGKNAALSAAEKIRRKVVIGHVHSAAGVQYSCGPFDTVWGLSCGALVQPDHAAYAYGKHLASRPVLGAGAVLGGVPMFVPLGQ